MIHESVTEHQLTAYQKDIWLEQCIYPEKPIYNVGGYTEIKSAMNKDIIRKSIEILIQDNDSLRIRVIEKNGVPYLNIFSEVCYEVPYYDFSDRENSYAYGLDWLKEEFRKTFSFDGNLFQFAFLKIDHKSYFLLIKVHHIVSDGMGLSILFRQIFENYNQLITGVEKPSKAIFSYTDFIADNHHYMHSQTFKDDKEFWKQKYRTVPEPLFHRVDISDNSMISDRITLMIERALYNKITAFSDAQGCSVFHFMLAVLFVYFSRLCQRDELVIGVPILNRTKAKYKRTLGLFANVIPLRLNPGTEISFVELVQYIKNELMECYRHQKYPFGEIYRTAFEQIKEKRNIFDISFSYVKGDFSISHIAARDFQVVSLPHHYERNALAMFVRDYNDEKDVAVDLDYQISVFEKFVPIENMITHFTFLLNEVIENSEISINELEIMHPTEKSRLLDDFNCTEMDYPRDKTVHELFEEQVQKTPEHVAVVFEDKQLTYAELNARVNQLARVLRTKGVGPDNVVAIMTERSFEMVVGVLGVLKAGGAYLPIDPDYPAERIKYMLEDSAAGILLTQRHVKNTAGYPGDIIDIADEGIYEEAAQNPTNINNPNDLAYVIYTSGSTGQPKGVMIEHRGIANLKTFFQQTYSVGEQDRMLQFASSSFDASVWELFTSLLNGATLVLVSRDTINNYVELERFIDSQGVTIALFPPPYFAGINPDKVRGLKKLVTGGSAITKELIGKWRDKVKYMNAYGPTESTVIATTWQYNEQEFAYGPVPIGTPVNNTEIFILDRHNNLMPIGAAGELCIAGDGLARGYLYKPELTAEKFVLNPFASGKRIYKTGDLARWLPNGNIEFIGRIDHQVKVRGFRIELGEIEAKLLKHEAVKEAVVYARADKQGEKYLVACFVANRELPVPELREQLLKVLPGYMVPSYFIQLDRMPLTANDKIDRQALPEPETGVNTGVEYMAPRNEIEEILVQVWEEVLHAERIGIKDHFFSLGGDSIKGIQVLSRLSEYGLKLAMKDLFKYPAIAELSDVVTLAANTAEQGVVEGEVGLTPIQKWFFEQDFQEKHHFNQAVMLYREEGFEKKALGKAFAALTEYHDGLRMVCKGKQDRIVMFNRGIEDEQFSLTVQDVTRSYDYKKAIAEEVKKIQESMDLSAGPLFKAGLFKTAEGDHLFIAAHHLVIDGVSWRIIIRDLFYAYRQVLQNESIKLAAKTDSFKKWSDKLAAYADSPELLGELEYWRDIAATEVMPLPKNGNVAVRRVKDNGNVCLKLTVEETAKLLKQVNAAYNTEINDILLTALGLAVSEWLGVDRVLINLEGHGREEIFSDIDISRTVGWFTSQYPVILNLPGENDLARHIKSVKEYMRHIPHKGIGYGILKHLTSPAHKDKSMLSLQPEISFNYLGQFDETFDNGVVTLSDIPIGECTSPSMENLYIIDINGVLINGQLLFNFIYNKHEYREQTISHVAESFRKHLVKVIDHCTAIQYTERTPSDFTFSRLSIDELETVLGNVDRMNVQDLYLLSPMQEGVLFHALKEPGSAAYFEQTVLSVEGSLDIKSVQKSFSKLIEKHDVFRTVFIYEKVARPLQIVLKERTAHIFVKNIDYLTEAEQETCIEEFKTKDRVQGFDLRVDLPIRLSIIRTGAGAYKLIWSFHHIIMDGWCLGIILGDFLAEYAALLENRRPELNNTRPYSDYMKWLSAQNSAEAAAYWTEYLSNYDAQASLPKNNVPDKGKYQPAEHCFRLAESLSKDLEKLARHNNVTLNTIMQTLWGILLQRYNNTDDVVFGAVVSGRPPEITGVEKMVGLFINTLPVRIKCDANQTFAQLLHDVQQAALDSEQYSYHPLAEIQTMTDLKAALIDHILAFENYPLEEAIHAVSAQKSGFAITSMEAFEQTNYDLNMIMFPGQELGIKFSFNAHIYDEKFIKKLGTQLKLMIEAVTVNPEIQVKDINIVTEAEQALLQAFNNTETDYPKDKTLAELFEEQVQRTPNNVAVVFEDKRITYRELNDKANQVARMLRHGGVTANSIVGIMAERSPEMIIGILGIVKAGGAYLPIDPDYPGERISYVLQDSGTSILLTQGKLADKATFNGCIFDLGCQELYQGNTADLATKNTAQDLVYVIYTSGSTGKPKGVEIRHASLVNLICWHRREYGITPADRATQVAGQAFDASVWELWPYLVSGAGIYIAPNKIRISTTELIQWLKDNRITISFLPTPLAEALLGENWPADISLRVLLTGGDALHRRPSKELPFTVVNHYGPTENTVVTSCAPVSPVEPQDILPSIGRPVDNTQIYIVDKRHRLQPIGAPGELCISGDGLARGYLNRPELTTERFVANPHLGGERMYKTGDLARWLPDGNIEFLGRQDHQVKIRGFRIELGEIEAQLLKHESVKEAIVIAREDKHGDKCLAAYIVTGRELVAQELRDYLLTELPEYMVPPYFTQLDKLPLTPNGKIDRKALPEPEGRESVKNVHLAPRHAIDEKVQAVWQEVLGLEMIGIDDNFFMLGGNSIKAIQVVSKLALDFEIGINDIFQYQTIRTLADEIKYAKDRLKETITVMSEVAAAKKNGTGFDGELQKELKAYNLKHRVYEKVDLSERAGYENILLAGSTGYLGIHILYQLIKNTDYVIYALVRGKNDLGARERLWAKLDFHFKLDRAERKELENRIHVFSGDLSQERLGLSTEKYSDLANKIDCVINAAANVKHYGHYADFYEVNVMGNQRLVEFARTGRNKVYNFISTTSVGSGFVEEKARLLFTEYDCDVGQTVENYYVDTKLAAEKFLRKAREEGLEANVFRVGNLVFDSTTGIFQENITDNAFYTLLKSLINIGYFPSITEQALNFSFIDYVARAIVLLFDKKNLQNETHHLFNNKMVSMTAMAEFLIQAGIRLNMLPTDEFVKHLFAKYEDSETKEHISRILVHSNLFFEGASKTSFITLNHKTTRILKSFNFAWPELDSVKVKLMMDHCQQVGFIQQDLPIGMVSEKIYVEASI